MNKKIILGTTLTTITTVSTVVSCGLKPVDTSAYERHGNKQNLNTAQWKSYVDKLSRNIPQTIVDLNKTINELNTQKLEIEKDIKITNTEINKKEYSELLSTIKSQITKLQNIIPDYREDVEEEIKQSFNSQLPNINFASTQNYKLMSFQDATKKNIAPVRHAQVVYAKNPDKVKNDENFVFMEGVTNPMSFIANTSDNKNGVSPLMQFVVSKTDALKHDFFHKFFNGKFSNGAASFDLTTLMTIVKQTMHGVGGFESFENSKNKTMMYRLDKYPSDKDNVYINIWMGDKKVISPIFMNINNSGHTGYDTSKPLYDFGKLIEPTRNPSGMKDFLATKWKDIIEWAGKDQKKIQGQRALFTLRKALGNNFNQDSTFTNNDVAKILQTFLRPPSREEMTGFRNVLPNKDPYGVTIKDGSAKDGRVFYNGDTFKEAGANLNTHSNIYEIDNHIDEWARHEVDNMRMFRKVSGNLPSYLHTLNAYTIKRYNLGSSVYLDNSETDYKNKTKTYAGKLRAYWPIGSKYDAKEDLENSPILDFAMNANSWNMDFNNPYGWGRDTNKIGKDLGFLIFGGDFNITLFSKDSVKNPDDVTLVFKIINKKFIEEDKWFEMEIPNNKLNWKSLPDAKDYKKISFEEFKTFIKDISKFLNGNWNDITQHAIAELSKTLWYLKNFNVDTITDKQYHEMYDILTSDTYKTYDINRALSKLNDIMDIAIGKRNWSLDEQGVHLMEFDNAVGVIIEITKMLNKDNMDPELLKHYGQPLIDLTK